MKSRPAYFTERCGSLVITLQCLVRKLHSWWHFFVLVAKTTKYAEYQSHFMKEMFLHMLIQSIMTLSKLSIELNVIRLRQRFIIDMNELRSHFTQILQKLHSRNEEIL